MNFCFSCSKSEQFVILYSLMWKAHWLCFNHHDLMLLGKNVLDVATVINKSSVSKNEKKFLYFYQWKGYEQSCHSLIPATWVGACKGPGGVYADDWASYNVFFLLDKTLVYQMWQIRCSSSTLLHYFTLRIRWCAGLAFCFCFFFPESKFINVVLSTLHIVVSQNS